MKSQFDDIIADLDQCGDIPEGCFTDSVFVYRDTGERRNCQDCPTVLHVFQPAVRNKDRTEKQYPAPTLLELLKELPDAQVSRDIDPIGRIMFTVSCGAHIVKDSNPAVAALDIWLKREVGVRSDY